MYIIYYIYIYIYKYKYKYIYILYIYKYINIYIYIYIYILLILLIYITITICNNVPYYYFRAEMSIDEVNQNEIDNLHCVDRRLSNQMQLERNMSAANGQI